MFLLLMMSITQQPLPLPDLMKPFYTANNADNQPQLEKSWDWCCFAKPQFNVYWKNGKTEIGIVVVTNKGIYAEQTVFALLFLYYL